MVSTNQIRDEYRMEYVSVGADKVAADANRVASATDGVSVATEKQERKVLTLTSAVERFNARNDALYRMQQQLERGQSLLNRAMEQGLGDTEAYRRGVEILTQQQQRYIQMTERAAAANSNVKAGLESAANAATRAAAGWAALGAQGAATMQGLDVARRMGSASAIATPGMDLSSLRGLRSEIDPIWAAQEKLNKSLADANRLRQAGLVSQDAYAGYVARASQAHETLTRKIEAQASASQRAAAQAAIQARQAQADAAQVYAGGYQRAIDTSIGIRAPLTADQSASRQADFAAAAEGADRLRAKYDPLFAAQRAYRADLAELRGALNAGILAENAYSAALDRRKTAFAEQVAGLGRVSAAQREATAAAERLQAANDRMARGWAAFGAQGAATAQGLDVARRMSMSGAGGAASLNQTRAEIDPVWKSQERLNKSLADANSLRKDGLVTEAAYTRYVSLQREAHADVVKKTAANQNGRLDAQGGMNMFFQSSDIFTQASMGTNPLLIAAQQGPQIAQSFVGPGSASLKGVFAQASEGAASLAARIGLVGGAIGGLTTAVVSGAAAWASYRSEQRDVERQLDGLGRASGMTLSQINAVAEQRTGAGLSVSESRRFQGEYAATGKIGSEIGSGLQARLQDYAALTGQDTAEANKVLAVSFADPTKGAESLSQQLGILDDASLQVIRRLDAQGDRLGAQRVLMQALADGTKGAGERLGFFSRQWTTFWNNTSNEIDGIGRFLDRVTGGGDLETRLAAARQKLQSAPQDQPLRNFRGALTTRGGAQAEVERLEQEKAAEDRKIEEAQRNQRSLEIGVVVRSLNPEMAEFRALEDQATKLRAAIEKPVEWKLKGRDIAEAETAFGRISEKVRQAREDIERFGSVAAGMANREADDRRALVGLPEFERNRTQIEQQYRARMRDDNLPLDMPGAAAVQSDYARRMSEATWPEKIEIDKGHEERLRRARLADAYRRQRDVAIDTLGETGSYDATRRLRGANDNLAAVRLLPYQRRVAELEARQRDLAEADRSNPNATALNRRTFAAERASLDFEAFNRPLREAKLSLTEQVGLLQLQQDAFGATTEEAARLAEQHRLRSGYIREGIDLSKLSVDVGKQVEDGINRQADAYAKVVAQQDELARKQRQVVQGLDDIRGGTRGALTDIFSDMSQGKDPSKGILSNVQGMATRYFDRQVSAPFVENLLGQEGRAGGGMFGGALTEFLGGKAGLSKMDVAAGVVNLSGTISVAGAGLPSLAGGTSGVKDAGSFVSKVVSGGTPSLPGDMSAYAQAIKNIESSGGNYDALGKVITRKNGHTDRAYGAYQVMGDNIGPWTEKHLGKRMSPDEFLKDRAAQDRVFEGEFGSYVSRFGNAGDAASMWHSGRPLARAMGARDPLGTRTPDYVRSFTKDVERYKASALPNPDTATKMLDPALSGAADAAAKAAESVKKLQSDLTTLPTPLAQASQGLDQLGNSVGAKGGGLLQALASMFTGSAGAPASVPTATAATGYIPGYASGRLPSYAAGRLDPDPAGSLLSTRARVDAAGVIHGPGSGTSDSILAVMNERNPIRISDREAIIRADAVAYYGPSAIKAINERRLDRERVVERAMPASLAGAQGYALGRVPAYAEGRVPERPRASPIWMPPQPQTTSQPSGPSEVKLSVVNESGYPVRAEAREVPDGRGGRKQALVLIDTVAGAAQSPKVQSALKQSAVVQR